MGGYPPCPVQAVADGCRQRCGGYREYRGDKIDRCRSFHSSFAGVYRPVSVRFSSWADILVIAGLFFRAVRSLWIQLRHSEPALF